MWGIAKALSLQCWACSPCWVMGMCPAGGCRWGRGRADVQPQTQQLFWLCRLSPAQHHCQCLSASPGHPEESPAQPSGGFWGQGNNKDQAPGETNHFVRKEHKKDKRDAACSGERANPCELSLQGAGLTLHLAQALPQRVPVPCTESRNRGL